MHGNLESGFIGIAVASSGRHRRKSTALRADACDYVGRINQHNWPTTWLPLSPV